MIKLSEILLEIGEGQGKPYLLRRVTTDGDPKLKGFVRTLFYFDLDDVSEGDPRGEIDLEYTVYENDDEEFVDGRLDIGFDVKTDSQENPYDATNLGIKVMNRVMATVIDAIKSMKDKELQGFPITELSFNAEESKSTGN